MIFGFLLVMNICALDFTLLSVAIIIPLQIPHIKHYHSNKEKGHSICHEYKDNILCKTLIRITVQRVGSMLAQWLSICVPWNISSDGKQANIITELKEYVDLDTHMICNL
jgi:hypothetical protein